MTWLTIRRRTRQRLMWLSGHPHGADLHACAETLTLAQLEDSRRPLLFSLLPRMLRADGSTPRLLQRSFGYIDRDGDRAPAIMVSSERWRRARATSRRLAAGRKPRRKP